MHKWVLYLSVLLFAASLGLVVMAWREVGLASLKGLAAIYNPEGAGTLYVWMGLWEMFLIRCRQLEPLLLPTLSVLGIGVVQGLDWRASSRLRGHHPTMLTYGAAVVWTGLAAVVYATLRPEGPFAWWLLTVCLTVAILSVFCIVVGMPARKDG